MDAPRDLTSPSLLLAQAFYRVEKDRERLHGQGGRADFTLRLIREVLCLRSCLAELRDLAVSRAYLAEHEMSRELRAALALHDADPVYRVKPLSKEDRAKVGALLEEAILGGYATIDEEQLRREFNFRPPVSCGTFVPEAPLGGRVGSQVTMNEPEPRVAGNYRLVDTSMLRPPPEGWAHDPVKLRDQLMKIGALHNDFHGADIDEAELDRRELRLRRERDATRSAAPKRGADTAPDEDDHPLVTEEPAPPPPTEPAPTDGARRQRRAGGRLTMSERTYFAGQALAGLIAFEGNAAGNATSTPLAGAAAERIARECWDLADAMIAEAARRQRESPRPEPTSIPGGGTARSGL